MKNLNVKVILITLLLAFSLVPVMAQDSAGTADELVLFLVNGTGVDVVEVVIAPARGVYPGNQNRFHRSRFQLADKAFLEIVLPNNFQGISSFDIAVVTRNDRNRTSTLGVQNVRLNFSEEAPPFLELSRTRRGSSLEGYGGAIGALTGGLASATVLSTRTVGIVTQRNVLIVNERAHQIWRSKQINQPWGTPPPKSPIIRGAGWIYIIPVAVMVGGYFIGNQFQRALNSSGLDAQVRCSEGIILLSDF